MTARTHIALASLLALFALFALAALPGTASAHSPDSQDSLLRPGLSSVVALDDGEPEGDDDPLAGLDEDDSDDPIGGLEDAAGE